jgi:hypothetical protein
MATSETDYERGASGQSQACVRGKSPSPRARATACVRLLTLSSRADSDPPLG